MKTVNKSPPVQTSSRKYYGTPSTCALMETSILQKMFDEGVIYIRDILFVNGKLLPCDFFRAKGLNFNDFMLLTGLSKARPDST